MEDSGPVLISNDLLDDRIFIVRFIRSFTNGTDWSTHCTGQTVPVRFVIRDTSTCDTVTDRDIRDRPDS